MKQKLKNSNQKPINKKLQDALRKNLSRRKKTDDNSKNTKKDD